MKYELGMNLKLSQTLVMTPQLQMAIKLLQLSRMELAEMVSEELTANPVLEEPTDGEVEGEAPAGAEAETPTENAEMPARVEEVKGEEANEMDWESYLDQYSVFSPHSTTAQRQAPESEDAPSYLNTLTEKTTLQDHLLWQLGLSDLAEQDKKVAAYLIGNFNDDGYLEGGVTAIEDMANEFGLAPMQMESVLSRVQEFDPPGVGARDLSECLLLQAKVLKIEDSLVLSIIKDHLKEVQNRNYAAIARHYKVPMEEVIECVKLISTLDPKPGSIFSGEDAHYITPDVHVHKVGEEYMVVLNEDGMPKLRISNYYRDALRNKGGNNKEAKNYIVEKLRSAVWLIRSIHQRQKTILKVTKSIVKFQRAFFDKGVTHLKPLVLKDVATDIQMHESTVCRVTNNKFVHTPHGIFELKYFFNSGVSGSWGEDIASESVKSKLGTLMKDEDPKHPLSDQELAEKLTGQGVHVARRTVAKYREAMGILPSSGRKKLF